MIRTVALVLTAMTLVVVGDTAGKLLTARGVSPVFVAWSRFALAVLVLLPIVRPNGFMIRAFTNWRILLRGLLITGGICSILTALRTEPIANVFGGFFIGPVVAYALSAVFLRERVSVPRTVLLLISFAGVMLVVKPGFGMTPGMGFALLAGCFYGSFLVMTRLVAGTYPAPMLIVTQLMIGAVVLAPFGVGQWPATIDPAITGLIMISAFGSMGGNLLLIMASRHAPTTVIAPLVYSQLVVATVISVVVFDEWPDVVALIGLTVIVGAGLGSLRLTPTTSQNA